MMYTATARFRGLSALMYGKHVDVPKKDDETHDAYEERTWREKVHQEKDGNIFLQPFALKNCLEAAAKWLSMKIPGEGRKTFTARITSGILVTEDLPISGSDWKRINIDAVEPITLFVPSDGRRGSPKRVPRIFPMVARGWVADAEITVFDNKISPEVLEKHLKASGKFIGFGAMRVGNGGINGRFAVEDFNATEDVEADV